MRLFEHVPHPQIEQRRRQGPVRVDDQRRRDGPIRRLNAHIGLGITVIVGTMGCAYLFTLLALISFPDALSSGNKFVIVSWIAQTFLQLVLLPIIIVGQNIQAKAADARADQTFHDVEAILHEAEQIQAHLAVQDQVLGGLAERLGVDLESLVRSARPEIGARGNDR